MDLRTAITDAYERHKLNFTGKPADYLTALSHSDPQHFGIAAMTKTGELFEAGDTRVQFSIQSISKVFSLLLAFREYGLEDVYARVGAEPSGEPYNHFQFNADGKPYNPMVNSGAITVAGLLYERFGDDAKDVLTEFMNQISGGLLVENDQVREIEKLSGDRNIALAYILRHAGLLPVNIEGVIELYNWGCALETDAQDLAAMGACLANGGIQPKTMEPLLAPHHVQHTLSIMLTCGLYSGAGRWAVDIGVPAKSGVSGGLMASVVDRFGLGVYSPMLDADGNSVRAIGVCNELDNLLDIHAIMPLRKDADG
jgi:glutaminase